MSVIGGPKVVDNGLVLYYDAANFKSYPGSGISVTDISANNNTGILTTGASYSPDNGGVFTFDGSASYINAGNDSSLGMTTEMSVIAWFRINETLPERKCIVGKLYLEYEIDIYQSGMIHTYTSNGSGGYDEGISAYLDEEFEENDWLANKWYFLSWTLNGVHEVAYVNGIVIGTRDKPNPGTTISTNSVNIGRRTGGSSLQFDGDIAIVGIYNKQLSDNDVILIYDSTKGRFGL